MISRLVLVQSDLKVAHAIRFGFEREGIEVLPADGPAQARDSAEKANAELIVAGTSSSGAEQLLRGLREQLQGTPLPILWVGNGIDRGNARHLGATETLRQPMFVRDVVTMGKLLTSPKAGRSSGSAGELSDYAGLFYMLRALTAVERTGVLTLVRGLRRGELRFFRGEVTSAQVGVLHGLAALHQLLLWTDARFDLRDEDVVRRRQIPLGPEETLQDASRFLSEIRSVANGLSPSGVYEQDIERLGRIAATIPTAVHPVLRLFDGNRTIADVIEDSPFRVFETLRIAHRLCHMGVIRRVESSRPKTGARAALSLEEWLVGDSTPAMGVPIVRVDSQAASSPPNKSASPPATKSRRKSKRRSRDRRPPSHSDTGRAESEPGWSAILSGAPATDLPSYSQVVPSAAASGEITVAPPAASASVAVEQSIAVDDPPAPPAHESAVDTTNVVHGVISVEAEPPPSAAESELAALAEAEAAAAEAVALAEAEKVANALATARQRVDTPVSSQEGATLDQADNDDSAWTSEEVTLTDVEGQALADEADTPVASSESDASDNAAQSSDENTGEPHAAESLAESVAGTAHDPAATEHVNDVEVSSAETDEQTSAAHVAVDASVESVPTEATAAVTAGATQATDSVGAGEDRMADAAAASEGLPALSGVISVPDDVPAEASKSEKTSGRAVSSGELAAQQASDGVVTNESSVAASGEIVLPRDATPSAIAQELSGPSILVDSLTHDATDVVHAATNAESTPEAPETTTVSQPTDHPGEDNLKSATRGDNTLQLAEAGAQALGEAVEFSDTEEEFFRAGSELAQKKPPPVDNFDDLDTEYEPKTFWQRLFARPKEKSGPVARSSKKREE